MPVFIDIRGGFSMIEAFKVNSGRCTGGGGHCGKPAVYKQRLEGKKGFYFCEEHATRAVIEAVKKRAEEQAKQDAKK